MNRYLVFPESGGKPLHDLVCSPEIADLQDNGFMIIAPDWADTANCYMAGDDLLELQPLPIQTANADIVANGQDEAVIDNIPAGVSVTCNGDTQGVVDGKVEFSTDMPGTYRLLFTAVEYLDQEVVIEAVPAD